MHEPATPADLPLENGARRIDHLVLPVGEVEVARERYQRLGFTVAPTGVHPFGTENACVFLADGTFLEPLGIAQRETCEHYAREGNSFVAFDQAYRFRRGEEGFSHLVIASDDAKADHRRFRQEGLSGGPRVRFSRAFATPGGETARASFRLAFAADRRMPDAGYFACEVRRAPKVDRSALTAHANGASGLREVIGCEPNPTDFQYFFQTFLNQRHMRADSFGMSFETAGGRLVTVLTPAGLKAFHGMEGESVERGVRLRTFVIEVESLSATERLLTSNDVGFDRSGPSLRVPPAEGQGCPIVFQERA